MRSTLFQNLKTWTLAMGITAIAMAGCSSTGGYTMPGSNWLSWGRKKPANSTLASTNPPRTDHLPAPPSSLATPQTAPSYAQSGLAAQSATAASASAPGPNSWSSTPPAAASQTPRPGSQFTPAASPSTAQGFYSPQYGPASHPASHQPQHQPQHQAAPSGNFANQPGAGFPAAGASTAHGGSHPAGGYGGHAAATPQGGFNPAAGASTRAAESIYSQPPAAHHPPMHSEQMPGDYRPGSTARTTPYGSGGSLHVAEAPTARPQSDEEGEAAGSPGTAPASGWPQQSPAGTAPSYDIHNPNIYR